MAKFLKTSSLLGVFVLCLLGCAEDDSFVYSDAALEKEHEGLYDNDKLADDYLNPEIYYDEFVDERDGRVYKTIDYGAMTIMAQNMAFADSEMLPALRGNSWCYDDIPENCEKGGRLYSWNAANKVCPEGWNLITMSQISFVTEGGGQSAQRHKSISGWFDDGGGSDIAGYSVLPAGMMADGEFVNGGYVGYLWMRYDEDYYAVWHYAQVYSYDKPTSERKAFPDNFGASVRCVKYEWEIEPIGESSSSAASSSSNAPYSLGEFMDDRDGYIYKTLITADREWLAENLQYKSDSVICHTNYMDICDDSTAWFYNGLESMMVCPEGWHLPDTTEWNALFKILIKLDESDVRALGFGKEAQYIRTKGLGGYSWTRHGYDHYWSAEENDTLAMLAVFGPTFWRFEEISKQSGVSVRCVKD